MNMVNTNENCLLVGHVNNSLEAHEIDVMLNTEFFQGGNGELSSVDT